MTSSQPALEEALGFAFANPVLLRQALTHSSYVHERPREAPDNEALEFLGDAVLGLAVGHLLIEAFPMHRPGQLSKLRAAVVNEPALARLAATLDLGHLLLLGRGEEATGGRDKPSILAGAYEALLGAVYLDAGFPAALGIVRRQFTPLPQASADYKTLLQEHCQARHRVSPNYHVDAESGPPHCKTFKLSVWLGDRLLAAGEGRSKKQAEAEAAHQALDMLQAEEPAVEEPAAPGSGPQGSKAGAGEP